MSSNIKFNNIKLLEAISLDKKGMDLGNLATDKNLQQKIIHLLRHSLQNAIELEHATIPPYLTAQFTLFNTQNDVISKLIESVVVEEMLHLTIASNLLNAIGGHPVLNKKDFVPEYPGPLPGTVAEGLIVPLEKFSKELLEKVFMVIEEPEDPIIIKTELSKKGVKTSFIDDTLSQLNELIQKDSLTIGEFYDLIKKGLIIMNHITKGKVFCGDKAHQVVNPKWFSANELFAITDLDSALRAIDVIIDQGEGTSTDPFIKAEDNQPSINPEPAHYYRFQEIVKGYKLIADKDAPTGYAYAGPPIPFNGKVANMYANPKMEGYPKNSLAYANSNLFNYYYTNLLNCLHITFNGAPNQLSNAMGLMYSIRLYGLKLLSLPDPNNPGYVAGPSFQFITEDDLSDTELLEVRQNEKMHSHAKRRNRN
ncbi:ferritin-like domain-containing protein [Aureibacter tunicatorum]|uniref:Rubrerythrin n=1 Tax=Aureibacter tunicatorum TaxID=866807 RepID=A0AAE3XQ63_9BACT|nr:ferritin-like protein [Aureibacter tunicatorum]MDR6240590.1 rubrerythrin [Aureibacter tunicatorum]BDD06549.1 hypothetical protein AUTU_40320 [Aureibacter tunicatorum]